MRALLQRVSQSLCFRLAFTEEIFHDPKPLALRLYGCLLGRVSFSLDGRTLTSASYDGTVWLWRVK